MLGRGICREATYLRSALIRHPIRDDKAAPRINLDVLLPRSIPGLDLLQQEGHDALSNCHGRHTLADAVDGSAALKSGHGGQRRRLEAGVHAHDAASAVGRVVQPWLCQDEKRGSYDLTILWPIDTSLLARSKFEHAANG